MELEIREQGNRELSVHGFRFTVNESNNGNENWDRDAVA
jgi:hypothetical protein